MVRQELSHLTRDQIDALLRAAPRDRDRLALLLSYQHGLRVSEMIAITANDAAGGFLHIGRLKGSRNGVHSLISSPDPIWDEPSQVSAVVEAYQLGPDDRLFPHNRDYYEKLMKRVGIPLGIPRQLLHPHALRHSIAMHTVGKIDIHEVMRYMGHKSLNSTGQYLRATDAQASAAVVRVLGETK
jgi:type 1 fimbriae regulatory protein FimB